MLAAGGGGGGRMKSPVTLDDAKGGTGMYRLPAAAACRRRLSHKSEVAVAPDTVHGAGGDEDWAGCHTATS